MTVRTLIVAAALAAAAILPSAALADSGGASSALADSKLKSLALTQIHASISFGNCGSTAQCLVLGAREMDASTATLKRVGFLVRAGAFCRPQTIAYANVEAKWLKRMQAFGAHPTTQTRDAVTTIDVKVAHALLALVKAC